MSGRVLLGLSALFLAAGCGNMASQPSDCPFVLVALDAGTDAFASVGQYATGSPCARFCDLQHPVCQLVTPTVVKCQLACE
jgi:hypothetical protein